MSYVAVGLALVCVGLALKLMTMKSALTKATETIKSERANTKILVDKHDDLAVRSDARIKDLKGRVNELLEDIVEKTDPGDFVGSFNKLLQSEKG